MIQRVVEVAKLAVAMERHAVAPVAVIVERDRTQRDSIVTRERVTDVSERAVGERMLLERAGYFVAAM